LRPGVYVSRTQHLDDTGANLGLHMARGPRQAVGATSACMSRRGGVLQVGTVNSPEDGRPACCLHTFSTQPTRKKGLTCRQGGQDFFSGRPQGIRPPSHGRHSSGIPLGRRYRPVDAAGRAGFRFALRPHPVGSRAECARARGRESGRDRRGHTFSPKPACELPLRAAGQDL
jgi:hypothetical protein